MLECSHSKDTNIPLFVKSENRWAYGSCSWMLSTKVFLSTKLSSLKFLISGMEACHTISSHRYHSLQRGRPWGGLFVCCSMILYALCGNLTNFIEEDDKNPCYCELLTILLPDSKIFLKKSLINRRFLDFEMVKLSQIKNK